MSATTDVRDWQALAQMLDYDPIHQQELQTSGRNPDLCRKEMLTTWARKDQRASWEKLTEALDRMKQDQVAQKIREEFIPHQGIALHLGLKVISVKENPRKILKSHCTQQ